MPILRNHHINFVISPKKQKTHSESPSTRQQNLETTDVYSSRLDQKSDFKKPSLVRIKELPRKPNLTIESPARSKLKEYKNYVINLKLLSKNSNSEIVLPNLNTHTNSSSDHMDIR